MNRLCALGLVLLAGCGRDPFDEACDVLKRLPHGTEIRRIEQMLRLPAPRKTLAGSSLYHHRIFEYVRKDGLIVVIGLIQASPADTYQKGRFVARGDYGVSYQGRSWMQWDWDG